MIYKMARTKRGATEAKTDTEELSNAVQHYWLNLLECAPYLWERRTRDC